MEKDEETEIAVVCHAAQAPALREEAGVQSCEPSLPRT